MMVKHNGPERVLWARAVQLVLFVLLTAVLSGCAAPAAPAATATSQPDAAPTSVATSVPTSVPTAAPTATAVPTEQPTETAAPTAAPTGTPTATPVPELGVVEDGFTAWCAPESYAGTAPTGPDAPRDARLVALKGETLEVGIPAAYCVIDVQFNQPVPEGAQLYLYDSGSPFLKLPLTPAPDRPDLAWASVSHPYVVNPPYWDITYQVAVVGPDGQELWNEPLKFAKPLPEPCPYGGYPDPVTLWCAITDPWEIEPHPDATYPYDRSRLPTSEP